MQRAAIRDGHMFPGSGALDRLGNGRPGGARKTPARRGTGEALDGGMAKRWYTVHVLSNFEKKVAESIKETAAQNGLEEEFEDVLGPTEEVVELRRGKKVQTERRFMPGYVLVKMEMSDEAYHLVMDTNRVTGFLGPLGRPTPMRDSEVARIINQVEEGLERPRPAITFEIGEQVKVTDGPFESFTGLVEDVDEDNARLKVTVAIFGRATPVELEYAQVQKEA